MKLKRKILALFSIVSLIPSIALASCGDNQPTQHKMLKNPISMGQDPWVIKHNNKYYYSYMNYQNDLCISVGNTIQDALRKIDYVDVLPQSVAKLPEMWAPELHFINNESVVYFTGDENGETSYVDHRSFAITSKTPMGIYSKPKKLFIKNDDKYSIDGTEFTYDKQMYFIWSGWPDVTDGIQNLYIAKMKNSTTLEGQRKLIATPTYAWEKIPGGEPINLILNEGPEMLEHNGKIFLMYSYNAFWTSHYGVGRIDFVQNAQGKFDPMDPTCWNKFDKPLFESNKFVTSPGHASYVKSPSGKQDWMIYHVGVGGQRAVMMQQFFWNKDGTPNLGTPADPNKPFNAPV